MRQRSQELLNSLTSVATIDALRCDLAAETLRRGAPLRFRALGTSMIPAIWPGDLLLFEPVNEAKVQCGEIVLFLREQRLTAHRVQEIGKTHLRTRGDSMPACDPPVACQEVLGRLVAIQPNLLSRLKFRCAFLRNRLFRRTRTQPGLHSSGYVAN